MPIYEYKCDNGHVFEVMQSFSDDALTECQVCGAPVHKVFHPVSVHFKGSGFYNTDYGTKRRAREKAAGSKSAEGSSSSAEGSSSPSAGGSSCSSDGGSSSGSSSSSSSSGSGGGSSE